MSDPARRATRTLLQVSLVAAIIALLSVFDLIHWTDVQTASVMAVATPIIGFIQNILEDAGTLPPLLKPDPVPVNSDCG